MMGPKTAYSLKPILDCVDAPVLEPLEQLKRLTDKAESYMAYHAEKFYPGLDVKCVVGLWPEIHAARAAIAKAASAARKSARINDWRRMMGIGKAVKVWKLWQAWKAVKIQAARERTRETMKPGYSFKRTLFKGAKRAGFAFLGLFVTTLITFLGDGPALTTILIEASVHPAFVGVLVPAVAMGAEMLENARKQKG